MSDLPAWTDHARERARQRFPGVDLLHAYAHARRAGRKTKARIRDNCPVSARRWMAQGFKGRYFLIGPERIVFVMQAPNTIVTVFRLEDRPNQESDHAPHATPTTT